MVENNTYSNSLFHFYYVRYMGFHFYIFRFQIHTVQPKYLLFNCLFNLIIAYISGNVTLLFTHWSISTIIHTSAIIPSFIQSITVCMLAFLSMTFTLKYFCIATLDLQCQSNIAVGNAHTVRRRCKYYKQKLQHRCSPDSHSKRII